jgi:hypothetical protein
LIIKNIQEDLKKIKLIKKAVSNLRDRSWFFILPTTMLPTAFFSYLFFTSDLEHPITFFASFFTCFILFLLSIISYAWIFKFFLKEEKNILKKWNCAFDQSGYYKKQDLIDLIEKQDELSGETKKSLKFVYNKETNEKTILENIIINNFSKEDSFYLIRNMVKYVDEIKNNLSEEQASLIIYSILFKVINESSKKVFFNNKDLFIDYAVKHIESANGKENLCNLIKKKAEDFNKKRKESKEIDMKLLNLKNIVDINKEVEIKENLIKRECIVKNI